MSKPTIRIGRITVMRGTRRTRVTLPNFESISHNLGAVGEPILPFLEHPRYRLAIGRGIERPDVLLIDVTGPRDEEGRFPSEFGAWYNLGAADFDPFAEGGEAA